MTLVEFKAALGQDEPPEAPPLIRALWHDARGDWTEASDCAGHR
jgi:hypothetical protein